MIQSNYITHQSPPTVSLRFSLTTALLLYVIAFFPRCASSDPQTNLIKYSCHPTNATSPAEFFTNLNATFSDVRANISSPSSHFATSIRARLTQPVYTLFQCREYLSAPDCLACFATASAGALRTCQLLAGATFHYDGCFLRYEYVDFFDEITTPGQAGFCEDRTVDGGGFNSTASKALNELVAVVPARAGFFAAVSREATGGGGQVYAVAQCLLTVGSDNCGNCLQSAIGNVGGCLPAAGGRAVELGCFMRYSDRAFFNNSPQFDLDHPSGSGGSSKTKVIIGAVAAIGAAILMSLLAGFFCCRRSEDAVDSRLKGSNLGLTELRGPTIFQYQDLRTATRNFSDENKLGAGGFGAVYKGVMKDRTVVAVKKLMLSETSRARSEFETEVKLISNVRHRNLVRLLGCCNKGPELLLVYEYMPNGSLDKYLFGAKKGTLNWKQRFNIIMGTARGLAYLHEEFPVCIIHRDVKSSNILLDDDFKARVADFGLARLFPGDKSHLSTKFAGTLGYTAPEYAIHGHLTEKVDIYSYGLVVLEIVSGKRTNSLKLEPVTEYLLEWAWRLYESNSLLELVDESLDANSYEAEEVQRVIEIGLMCTQSAASRPAMSEVVVLLRSQGQKFELSRPNFIGDMAKANRTIRSDRSTSTQSSSSNATLTISQFSAR